VKTRQRVDTVVPGAPVRRYCSSWRASEEVLLYTIRDERD
jgi:hypothetical protein